MESETEPPPIYVATENVKQPTHTRLNFKKYILYSIMALFIFGCSCGIIFVPLNEVSNYNIYMDKWYKSNYKALCKVNSWQLINQTISFDATVYIDSDQIVQNVSGTIPYSNDINFFNDNQTCYTQIPYRNLIFTEPHFKFLDTKSFSTEGNVVWFILSIFICLVFTNDYASIP